MIKINIQQIAKKHGFSNAYGLQKALSCSPTMASRLWKQNFEQIGLQTLQKLCDLFNCELVDLVVITPKDKPQLVRAVKDTSKKEKAIVKPATVEMTGEKTLTTPQIAEILGVKRRTVNDWILQGRLKSHKGKQGANFVNQSDFDVFQKENLER